MRLELRLDGLEVLGGQGQSGELILDVRLLIHRQGIIYNDVLDMRLHRAGNAEAEAVQILCSGHRALTQPEGRSLCNHIVLCDQHGLIHKVLCWVHLFGSDFHFCRDTRLLEEASLKAVANRGSGWQRQTAAIAARHLLD